MATTPAPSFANDIVPLFTQTDVDHMKDQGVSLDDYAYMSNPSNAQSVYQQVSSGSMPPKWGGGEGPWPAANVALFKAWMDGGYQP